MRETSASSLLHGAKKSGARQWCFHHGARRKGSTSLFIRDRNVYARQAVQMHFCLAVHTLVVSHTRHSINSYSQERHSAARTYVRAYCWRAGVLRRGGARAYTCTRVRRRSRTVLGSLTPCSIRPAQRVQRTPRSPTSSRGREAAPGRD